MWPSLKEDREDFEIKEFIKAYKERRNFEIERRGEKPDYVVRDIKTGERFGIELTSVYLDNRSVPDVHMKDYVGVKEIPYNRQEIELYKTRIIEAILKKIKKAQNEYDTSLPLILAIYVNEYTAIHIDKEEWQSLVIEHEDIFDAMSPFIDIVFWFPNGDAFYVEPDSGIIEAKFSHLTKEEIKT